MGVSRIYTLIYVKLERFGRIVGSGRIFPDSLFDISSPNSEMNENENELVEALNTPDATAIKSWTSKPRTTIIQDQIVNLSTGIVDVVFHFGSCKPRLADSQHTKHVAHSYAELELVKITYL